MSERASDSPSFTCMRTPERVDCGVNVTVPPFNLYVPGDFETPVLMSSARAVMFIKPDFASDGR